MRLGTPGSPGYAASFGPLVPMGAVLRLVARGLTDAQVAGQLFLGRRTVSAHLQAIYGKLGVNTRGAAVHLAIEQGLD